MDSEKVTWLANQIFMAFTEEFTGLKFYLLNCSCMYYQRVLPDGSLDPKTGIYRDSENGACEICIGQEGYWKERVVVETIAYNSKFGLEIKP